MYIFYIVKVLVIVDRRALKKLDSDSDTKIISLHIGHRQRLRRKFLLSSRCLSDYELIELLLFYIFPRKDTKLIAKQLLQKFDSLKGIVFANKDLLKNTEGCGDFTVF